ncbi:MAG: HAD-IIIA family hydrolase [Azospirillaceae bacterium]|nr:HAD-IIIA family hydrolase [Azospirillaceae bacterium]
MVILAGEDEARALVDVAGVPLLGRQLRMVAQSTLRDVLVLTGSASIAGYCGDGGPWGLNVRTAHRGDVGTLLADVVVVLPGDAVMDVDLDRLLDHHHRHGAAATLLLRPAERPAAADLVDLADDGRVRGFLPPAPAGNFHNLAWAGPYVVATSAVEASDLPGRLIFDRMLVAGRPVRGYQTPEYVRRIVSAGDLARARADVASGHVRRLSLRQALPAVFLDRDGVLNVERDSISRPKDLVLAPGAAPALARLNRADYRTAVVTNQAVVARGGCTLDGLAAIHARLETLLVAEGAYFDRLYFCPHHPDRNLAGGVPAFLGPCDCRKPRPGMVHAAAADLNIDLGASWMIGDSSSDIGLARAAGIGGILVRDGHGGRDGKSPAVPHMVVDDMAAAVTFILDTWPRLAPWLDGLAAGVAAGEVILIGGTARSGKTTLAQCLSLRLGQLGRRAVVVSLDNWLKSHDQRGEGDGVLDRYDLAAADQALTALLDRGTPVTPPRYDVLTRLSHPGKQAVTLAPDDILIVEGVPALTQAAWRALAARRWFVGGDEDRRQARFAEEYRRRGWPDDRVAATYQSRLRDELPIVLASRDHADRTVSLDEVLG